MSLYVRIRCHDGQLRVKFIENERVVHVTGDNYDAGAEKDAQKTAAEMKEHAEALGLTVNMERG